MCRTHTKRIDFQLVNRQRTAITLGTHVVRLIFCLRILLSVLCWLLYILFAFVVALRLDILLFVSMPFSFIAEFIKLLRGQWLRYVVMWVPRSNAGS
jgi:hypothetical protein